MPSPALSANGLLASLSAEDFEAIRPHLKTVELAQDRSLIELGEAVKHVHRARFICTVMNITFKLGHRLPVRPQPRFSHGLEVGGENAVKADVATRHKGGAGSLWQKG